MRNIDERIKFEPSGFDYVNTEAKVVIVGITPGNSQMKDSREGLSPKEIKRKKKKKKNKKKNPKNYLYILLKPFLMIHL